MKKNEKTSQTPYQKNIPFHPSMLEIDVIKPSQAYIEEIDPYQSIEKKCFPDRTAETTICIISEGEGCNDCKTCLRFGF